jgi:DNA-binding transcriptional LysR family regulator
MIDLRSLEVFFWVVKLGGFSRAAERLHMTQPAVSSRIIQMEALLRFRLLDRTTSRVQAPTSKGLELYAYAERILALHAEMMSRLVTPATLTGTVRIGVAETLVHTLLGAFLREMNDVYPGVTPEITVDTSPNLRAALLGGELDLALLLGPLSEPRVVSLPLASYDLVWVASPSLTLGQGRLDLRELARWPLLSYARGTQPHVQLSKLFAAAGLAGARIFANSSLASIVHLAELGVGVGHLPLALVEEALGAGRLRRLDVEVNLPPLRFTACFVPSPGGLVEAVTKLLPGDHASS